MSQAHDGPGAFDEEAGLAAPGRDAMEVKEEFRGGEGLWELPFTVGEGFDGIESSPGVSEGLSGGIEEPDGDAAVQPTRLEVFAGFEGLSGEG